MGGWLKLWSQLTRRGVETEVDEELGFHFDMLVREYEARGMDRSEAERRARERFGEMGRVRKEAVGAERRRVRRERRSLYLDGLLRDLRFGVRTLTRNRTFAMTAVLVLAVGIGANTAIFSAANAFLFRPLPFGDPDRLVMLYETNPEFGWADADAAPAMSVQETRQEFCETEGFLLCRTAY